MATNSVNLGPYASIILQIMLSFIMLSVSLEIKRDDWSQIKAKSKPFLAGMLGRLLVLPALVFLLCNLIPMSPALKLGFLLVAACPGGSISNFLVSLSKGDLVLSILLSLGSTFLAPLSTPISFEFWSSIAPDTAALFSQIALDRQALLKTITFSLIIPLSIGTWLAFKHPLHAEKLRKKTAPIGPIILLLFVIFAVAKNYQLIVSHFIDAFVPVVIINLVCLVFFYLYGKMWKLKEQACRAISIEVSIENNALAMLVALQFFPNQIEVLMVSVLWGLWQLASGWPLATYWSKTKG